MELFLNKKKVLISYFIFPLKEVATPKIFKTPDFSRQIFKTIYFLNTLPKGRHVVVSQTCTWALIQRRLCVQSISITKFGSLSFILCKYLVVCHLIY